MSDKMKAPKAKKRRVKTPTIIQMEATECGVVALAIVLAYYGKYVPIDELRADCGVSRDGSNAYNMIEGIKKYGFDAMGYSVDLQTLYELSLPCILHWKFTHFVVLEGFDKDVVYINDPATGPRTITYKDLNHSFTGVVIELKPNQKFQKSKLPKTSFDFILEQITKVKGSLFYAFAIGICLILPTLAIPAFSQIFIDQVLINQDLSWLKTIIVGLLLAAFFIGLLNYLQRRVLNRLRLALSLNLSGQSLWRLMHLPTLFYSQRYPGELATRIGLNEAVSSTLANQLIPAAISFFTAFVYGMAMFYYNFYIAFFTFCLILLNIAILTVIYQLRRNAYIKFQSDLGRSQAYSIGGIQNIETIKASGLETRFFSQWAGYYTKMANTLQDVGKNDTLISLMNPITNGLATLILFSFGVWSILHGHMSVGMFVAIQFLQRNFMGPVLNVLSFNQIFQQTQTDVNRIKDLMDYPIDKSFKEQETSTSLKKEKLTGEVRLQSVDFGYQPFSDPIIKNFSLHLRPGMLVGIKGKTGSGKTTIAKIIAGLITPTNGEILYDGLKRDEISRINFVDSIAMIEQEHYLFSGSIRENITLFDPQTSEENIIQATKDACIHDEIISSLGGYDFKLNEQGSNLSGGQKQRIEIARNLIKNPSLIILDEATSSLDYITEGKIINNLKRRGSTILVISHRPSLLKNCNQVFEVN